MARCATPCSCSVSFAQVAAILFVRSTVASCWMLSTCAGSCMRARRAAIRRGSSDRDAKYDSASNLTVLLFESKLTKAASKCSRVTVTSWMFAPDGRESSLIGLAVGLVAPWNWASE
eukprot:9503854-Pyramimonas_sp.AAC.1